MQVRVPVRVSSLLRFDRWQRRIDFRSVVRRSKSFQGVALILLYLMALPALYQLVWDGPFDVAGAADTQIVGALILAHLTFGLTCAAMVWTSTATGLVLRFQHAPLRGHPKILPIAVLHEVLFVGIGRGALFSLALLYALHQRLFGTIMGGFADWAMHLVLMAMAFVAIGAAVVHRVRRGVLRATDPRHQAMLANKRGVLAALIVGIGGFGGEMALADFAPAVLEKIGEFGMAGALVLLPPLHAVLATSPLPGLAWLVVGGSCVAVLWHVGLRSASGWVLDLPVDHHAAPPFTPDRIRALIVGRGPVRKAAAFAAKDLILPVVRSPARHAIRQWFAWAAMAGVLVLVRYAVDGAAGSAAPILLPVLVAAYALIQAAPATLHLLGLEGRRIALLLPIQSAWGLLLLKGAPAILFVAAHTLAGSVLLLGLAWALGFSSIPVLESLAVALVAGPAAAALGVSVGFLLPDFERRSVGQPGATLAARLLFFAAGTTALVLFGVLEFIETSSAMPRVMAVGFLGVLPILVLAVSAIIALAGLHQLSRLEV